MVNKEPDREGTSSQERQLGNPDVSHDRDGGETGPKRPGKANGGIF